MDPLDYETAEWEKLDKLAEKRGWTTDTPEYKKHAKHIRQRVQVLMASQRQAAAKKLPDEYSTFPDKKIKDWATLKKITVADLAAAKASLKQNVAQGTWKQDRRSGNSKTKGNLPCHRFVCFDSTQGTGHTCCADRCKRVRSAVTCL